MIAKVAYGRRCQMGDVHTTRMRSGLGRVREYGVSFASPPPPSFWYIVSLDDKNPINILDWKTIDDIDTIKSAFNRIERERSASGLKTLGRNVTFDSKFDAFKRALESLKKFIDVGKVIESDLDILRSTIYRTPYAKLLQKRKRCTRR